MKIKLDDLLIPEASPFENCQLKRKQHAEVLNSIVSNYADGFVLAINNRWGTGKTTFVKMWRQHLINNDFETLYFNAWENDFHNDVIIALLSVLQDLKGKSEESFNTILSKSAKFLKRVFPVVAKGVADRVMGEQVSGEILKEITEFGLGEVEREIQNFSQKKNGIKDFRESLEAFINASAIKTPLIFIVDELDRCRPSYAVEVMEQIKHLFSVPGIVFVLSIDKIQLGNAVRGFYGSDLIDSDEYLRRFIDLEYSIPVPNKTDFVGYLYEYYEFDSFIQSEARRRFHQPDEEKDHLKRFAGVTFNTGNYTLRQMEKSFSRIRLVLSTLKENRLIFPDLYFFLDYLRDHNPEFYSQMKSTNVSLQGFLERIEKILDDVSGSEETSEIQYLIGSLLYRYSRDYSKKHYQHNYELIENTPDSTQFRLSLSSKLEDKGNNIARRIATLERGSSNIGLNAIMEQLEISNQII